MYTPFLRSICCVAFFTLLFSCKKETIEPTPAPPANNNPTYTIATSYTFSNADYTSSTQRLAMLGELINHIRATHTTTATLQPTISALVLKNMYANSASPFSDAALNASGLQLRDQCSALKNYPNEIEAVFDDAQSASTIAAANPTTTSASNGNKGKLVSPSRAILVNANGFEYKELAEKGMMGCLLYYQAMTLLHNISAYDNTQVVNGRTAQEKAWDEAFGYFGVPQSFPTSTTSLRYWGNYCNSVNVATGSNTLIMNAFLKGRSAISNKDQTARDEAKLAVMRNWEKVGAAKCISYLKTAKNNLSDKATLHHVLSEAHGFVLAFYYSPAKTISDADIAMLLNFIGTNLYDFNPANLDPAIAKLETVFGLTAAQIP